MRPRLSASLALVGAFLFTACGSTQTVTVTATNAPTATPTPKSSPTVTPAQQGTITGSLQYPADFLPPQLIVAFPVGGSGVLASVATAKGQQTYSLSVAPGTYHVVAYVNPGAGNVVAQAYDKAMICWGGTGGANSTCTDTTLVDVTVGAGQTVRNINPQDSYNNPVVPSPPATPPTVAP